MDTQQPTSNPTPPAANPAPQPVPPVPENSPPPPPPPVPPASTTPPPPENPPSTSGGAKGLLPLFGLILIAIGVGLVVLWFLQSQSPNNQIAVSQPGPSIATPQKIVVGTDPTYPPMEYEANNVLLGYDIDLANFLGKEIGAPVEFRSIVFDDLFPSLEKSEIDMIISTVTVTDERKQKYDFSDPYLQGGQVILTKKDNTTITTTADLKGKKIAVQKGTTIETEALKYTTDELVIRYPDFVQATAALVKGEVDAIFADLPGAKGITNDNPTLKIASDPFTQEYYAVVFRKGDPMIKDVNKALNSLKVKGILADLKQQWLDP